MAYVRSDLEGIVHPSFWIGNSELAAGGRYRYQFPNENGKLAVQLNGNLNSPDWDAQTQCYQNIVRYAGNFWIANYGSVFTNKQPNTQPLYWSPYAFPTYPDDGVGLQGEIRIWHKNFFALVQTPLITSTTFSNGNVLGNLKDTTQSFLPANAKVSNGLLHINHASGNNGLFANVTAITDNNNLSITLDVNPGNNAPYKLYNSPVLHPSWVECNGQVCNTNGSAFYGMTIPNLNKSPVGEKTPGQTLYADNSTTNRQMYLYGSTASGVFKEFAFRAEQATEQYNAGIFSVVYIMRVML